MNKLLMSIMSIGIAAAFLGAGTFAYFSDTETSVGNTFTAGTIDLTLGGTGATGVNFINMAPDDIASATITVTNSGTLAGWLGAQSSYVEADISGGAAPNVNADWTADMLIITAFTADSIDILGQIPDVGSAGYPTTPDGRKTVWDMVHDTTAITPPHAGGMWYSYDENMASGTSHVYSLTVKFDPTAGNNYQGDGIVWTFVFLLDQL